MTWLTGCFQRPLDSTLPISPMNGMQPHLENAPSFIDPLVPKKARYDGLDPSVVGPGHGPIGVPPLSAQRPFGAPGAAHAASSFGGLASGSVNMSGVNQQQEHGSMNQAQQGANIPGMQQGASFGMMGMGGFGMGFPFNMGMVSLALNGIITN